MPFRYLAILGLEERFADFASESSTILAYGALGYSAFDLVTGKTTEHRYGELDWHKYADKYSKEPPNGTKGGMTIKEGKFDFLFGRVTSNPHNTARSQELQSELAQIDVYDTPSGRQAVSSHFNQMAGDPSSVIRTYSNTGSDGITRDFEIRESLFFWPGSSVRLETTFEVGADGASKFVTTIPYR